MEEKANASDTLVANGQHFEMFRAACRCGMSAFVLGICNLWQSPFAKLLV